MKITDNYVLIVMFFIPFLCMQCFAEWGKHGQAKRYQFNDSVDSKSLGVDTTGNSIDGFRTSTDTLSGLITDSLVENNAAKSGELTSPESTSIYRNNFLEKGSDNASTPVYNFSISDLSGLMLESEELQEEPLATIRRYRGTISPDGDTVRFKVPLYGNISLENIEFSGIKYKEPQNLIQTDNLENPNSFASGLWTAISSLGGIITMAAVTEPAFSEESDRAMLITMCISGYIASGFGQYFGVRKMAKHFRWNNEFGNRLSLEN